MNTDLRARGRQNEGLEIQENKLLKSAGGNRSYSQGQAGKKKKTGREQSKTPAYARANKNHKHEEHRRGKGHGLPRLKSTKVARHI